MVEMIPTATGGRIATANERLKALCAIIKQAKELAITREKLKLKAIYEKVEILSPQNTLRRGYSITTVNGRAVSDVATLHPGDNITTTLANGSIISTITQTNDSQENGK